MNTKRILLVILVVIMLTPLSFASISEIITDDEVYLEVQGE